MSCGPASTRGGSRPRHSSRGTGCPPNVHPAAASCFGFTSFGQSIFEDTDDDGIPDTRLPDFDNPLQGLTGGIISGGDFAVPFLLNALSSDDRANILSMPSVLVNNNEAAVVRTE
jgi:hypothetical protein